MAFRSSREVIAETAYELRKMGTSVLWGQQIFANLEFTQLRDKCASIRGTIG